MNTTRTRRTERSFAAFRTIASWTLAGLAASATAAMVAVEPGRRAGFDAANAEAMRRMMDGMTIVPSGDLDRDFATMMAAHHQGAIDMAEAELRYGRNETLRRIAQGIVVEQRQEITAMEAAADGIDIANARSASEPARTRPSGSDRHD